MRTYRLATMHDAHRLLALCRSARVKLTGVPSVTFVAEEDGQVEAAIGVDWEGDAVVAGPLVVASGAKQKRWMILRLIETLEQFLTDRQVRTYLLSCAVSNVTWNRILQKTCRRYATRNGRYWYIREVGSYGQSQG